MTSPDPTCGYISGLSSSPLTCHTGYCGFNSNLGAAGCCTSSFGVGDAVSLTGCNFITACYAATDIESCAGSCSFSRRDLLCSDPASPECVKYTFTDISSAALFCSDQSAVIDMALTVADAVATTPLSPSPGGAGAGATTAVATARSTPSSATYTSSYVPPKTSASSTVVPTTGSVATAGAPNPFTQTQASGNHVGGVGTATPVATGGCGKSRIPWALRLVGCSVLVWASVVV